MEAKTPANQRSKKRRAIRAAFVVTASLAAPELAGCESVITNPPFIECPNGVPSQGDACTDVGDCTYTDDCGIEITASCGADKTWDIEYGGTCNPPPPFECPTTLPVTGDPCFEEGSCNLQDECGEPILVSCDGTAWDVEPSGSCNPPPPCPAALPEDASACSWDVDFGPPVDCAYDVETLCGPQTMAVECIVDEAGTGYVWQHQPLPCTPTEPSCSFYDQSSLCDADTTCRWLVPGCGAPPDQFAPGCYPIADCTANSCPLDQACTLVSENPCWNSSCGACGADANICLPSLGG